MPRQGDDSNYAAAAQLRAGDIDFDLAELFASRVQDVDELFADPVVGMRIGLLITAAMNKPAKR